MAEPMKFPTTRRFATVSLYTVVVSFLVITIAIVFRPSLGDAFGSAAILIGGGWVSLIGVTVTFMGVSNYWEGRTKIAETEATYELEED